MIKTHVLGADQTNRLQTINNFNNYRKQRG